MAEVHVAHGSDGNPGKHTDMSWLGSGPSAQALLTLRKTQYVTHGGGSLDLSP